MDKSTSCSCEHAKQASRRLLAGLLAVGLAFCGLTGVRLAGGSQAYAAGENTTPKEEVAYARLAHDGAVKSISVVNVLNPEHPGKITDYGSYATVKNLTDLEPLEHKGDAVTVEVVGDSLSYQGDMTSSDLPWNIAVAYQLDGKHIKGAELAGKSGALEITITTQQNKAIDEAFFNNYLVQITCSFASDKARDVATDEGQIALAGSDTQVTFTGMPEKAGTFKLRAEVTDFEMAGISCAAVPFSMVIDSPDTEDFISGFKKLNEGVGELNSGALTLAQGAQSVSSGMGGLAEGADGVAGGASKLAEGLGQVAGYSEQILGGMNELSASGKTIAQSSAELNSGLSASVDALEHILSDPGFQSYLGRDIQGQAYLAALNATLYGQKEIAAGNDQLNSGVQGYTSGVSELASEYDGFNKGLASSVTGAQELKKGAGGLASGAGALNEGASGLASGASQLSGGTAALYVETQAMPDAVRTEIDNMMAAYDKSDFKPKSFTSTKNANVELVQFVIATDPIEIEAEKAEEEVATEENFITRLLKLFGL